MKRDFWNRCAECGRTVAYKDIADGVATAELEGPPDDERSVVYCREHAATETHE